MEEITPEIFRTWITEKPEEVYVVDVREPHEHNSYNIGGINIPMSILAQKLGTLPEDKQIVFYCHAGIRSLLAVEMATDYAPKKLKTTSLKYGITGW